MGNQSPPPPSRRFLPQPVETSSRSFRHLSPENPKSSTRISSGERSPVDDGPPRMPREQSSHGDSENTTMTFSCPPPGAALQQTQTISTSRKRFLPQPTETFTRSPKDRWTRPGSADDHESSRSAYFLQPAQTASNASANSASQSARRSLPQPVETVSRSSKRVADRLPGKSPETHLAGPSKGPAHETSGNKPSVRRFVPEPIESVKLSNRKDASSSDGAKKGGPSSLPLRTAPRKFAPQLIETAKRSFRRGEAASTLTASTDAEHPSGHRRLPRPSISSAAKSDEVVPPPQESRFSYASLVRRQGSRRHSFRVPDLPAIPSQSSEGSDGSNVPSLSTSPSTSSDESARRSNIRDQCRESCDERFSGYLLSLAARSAEKQLRNQALAAFPNEQVYQPVSHFAIDREEEDPEDEDGVEIVLRDIKDDITTFRRESIADLPWELEQMRRYKEMAETRNREKGGNLSESRFSAAAIAARRALNSAEPAVSSNIIDGWQKGIGLTQMTHAISPPMLGGDLVFPQSLSPQSTRCDIDHAPVPREETSSKGCDNCGGLWCVNPHVDDDCAGGLWMGTCRKVNDAGRPSTKASRPGIMTPTTADPDDQSHLSLNSDAASNQTSPLPTTPQEADPLLEDVDRKLSLEEEIEREFHDGFVTQIYNYLSLGYPCLARYYDDELSRISGIPVEELRRDDSQTDAKGYVGAPEGAGVGEEGVTGGKCMRWTALRLYIREWARQQPRMSGSDGNLKTWGVRERRGSWAI